jgi:hypothetical protein
VSQKQEKTIRKEARRKVASVKFEDLAKHIPLGQRIVMAWHYAVRIIRAK